MKIIGLEEHCRLPAIEELDPTTDVPIFADVERQLVDTKSLRIDAMDDAGVVLSILLTCGECSTLLIEEG